MFINKIAQVYCRKFEKIRKDQERKNYLPTKGGMAYTSVYFVVVHFFILK